MEDYSQSTMLPITTSYHGHMFLALTAKVRYTDKSNPKVHYCTVTIMNRKYNDTTGLIYEHPYAVVKAWQGDNNTIHFLQPLPTETEDELNLEHLFAITPSQEDKDELRRAEILGELLAKEDN